MKVAVSQTINCAHQLPGTKMHGHTYRVTVILSADVGPSSGLTYSFALLTERIRKVLTPLDHNQLETTIGEPATAERLAYYVKAQFGLPFCQVRVEVGDDGWVETE